ncbi:MAG: winged helix-turn-helix domain-containing protein [Faecalimonas umbilicata]|uniref:winged helix-turn-helix domain-containing protein n=1 Tax=Faecalimonas umbilicata TaxID=1912855 RepID=UPI002A766637|nr:winged helix-turn-helix domain-containing protein [Faecalimonas umbilicata]MDY2761149.1 winged helix-turn-helix domain-containing protein [Faecalimonas umbilicata]
MKKNRIIVLTDESGLSWDSLGLLEQQAEIYLAKGTQDTLSHLTIFSYHLILIALQQEPEIVCQFVEAIRKLVITPMIVLLPDHSEMRNKIIQVGADVVLTQLCTEEISLQAYALIRRYTEWKVERKEEIPIMVGKLEILPLQRIVEWDHKIIPVVKREFDFLHLLASTPGRVYTYSQIYHLVWQEYPHGDITNIIYCMVHRLKQKLKKVDSNAEHIISSVKEVGYCLKVNKE